jgi:hypothetical protein
MNIEKSKAKLESAIQEYVDAFCEKHELELDWWVADMIGGVASMGDYYVSFENMRLDLEQDTPKGWFFRWYNESLEDETATINYYSWLKGRHKP